MSDRDDLEGSVADGERETLVRVSWMYYRDGLTQAAIAERLHVSRATVARLIDRAKRAGVVTIDIDTSGVGGIELASALRSRYDLDDVVIVPQVVSAPSGETTNTHLATEAAQYVRRYLTPGAVIGVGWGDTVLRTLLALRGGLLGGVTFATLTGGIDAYTARLHGTNGVAERIRFVPSPMVASTPEVAVMLRREKAVNVVIDLARHADATLIGIGAASGDATISQNGLVTPEQIAEYRARGAVGDILAEWFDENGRVLDLDLERLRVGVHINDLRGMRNVVGVAGGIDKIEAIRGALRGGFLNVLITTEDVARALSESEDSPPPGALASAG